MTAEELESLRKTRERLAGVVRELDELAAQAILEFYPVSDAIMQMKKINAISAIKMYRDRLRSLGFQATLVECKLAIDKVV